MKTTVEISDPLLRRAKRAAARRGTTLRTVIEDALRQQLDADQRPTDRTPIATHTFGGDGLQPGLSWDEWGAIRSASYEGRGG